MSKIEKLTKEQEAMLPVYRDKWLKIGLATGPANREKAEDALNRAYKIAGLEPPKQIVWSTSPLAGAIVVSILRNDELMKKMFKQYLETGDSVGDSVRASVRDSVGASVLDSVGASVWASVWASVGDSVGASVWASVWDSVRDSVRDSVWDSVGDSVRASVWDSVWASVRDSVWDSVWASVWDSVRDSVGDSVGDSVCGNHEAPWLGFYDYFLEQLKIKSCKKLIPLMDFAKEGGWFYPYQNICVVTERPVELHMKEKVIHKDGGPAIRYLDDFSIWALNGVRVSQEIAETKADKLDVNLVVKEQNAEVRRELVRKIGIERIYKELGGKTLDSKWGYDLVTLNLGDKQDRPYLKMLNPSIGTIHLEGVPPDVKTVEQALCFRNGLSKWTPPQVLT